MNELKQRQELHTCALSCLLQVCDVSSLASVASFAADWLASSRPCHLLVNNAGVLVSALGLVTAQLLVHMLLAALGLRSTTCNQLL